MNEPTDDDIWALYQEHMPDESDRQGARWRLWERLMSTLGPGVRVMLIGSDGYMPPMGSRGVIVSDFDTDGDCDVLFPGCPCPHPPDTSWVAHWSWLLPLDDGSEQVSVEATSTEPEESV